jgi:hypothetical protein
MDTELTPADRINFQCNICGQENEIFVVDLERDKPSCQKCGSNVRLRSIIHLLSMELFQKSIPLFNFPENKNISGIGMSDWEGYAKILAKKVDYQNTYFHKHPRLDIKKIRDFSGTYDFIISSEIFEHIEYPVSSAFSNLRHLLNNQGFVLFSVPYIMSDKETSEYFPDLYKYEIVREHGVPVLKNTTKDGELQIFKELTFHGGEDTTLIQTLKRLIFQAEDSVTLEMRLFTKHALINEFEKAGFTNLCFFEKKELKWGILWKNPCGLPIVARVG